MVPPTTTMSMAFVKDCVYVLDQYRQGLEDIVDRVSRIIDAEPGLAGDLMKGPIIINPPKPPIPQPSGAGCHREFQLPDGLEAPDIATALRTMQDMTQCIWLALAGMAPDHQFVIPADGDPARIIQSVTAAEGTA
jgi:hypothetical protein